MRRTRHVLVLAIGLALPMRTVADSTGTNLGVGSPGVVKNGGGAGKGLWDVKIGELGTDDYALAVGISGAGSVGALVDTSTLSHAAASAYSQSSDLIFSGPDTGVTTHLTTQLHGVAGPGSVAITVEVDTIPPSGPVVYSHMACTRDLSYPAGVCNGNFTEPHPPFTDDLVLVTQDFTVPTLVYRALTIGIDIQASGGGRLDFSNTFSLPPAGPAFALPPGFTVDSVDARIQDNHWLPEPSPSLAAGASLLTVAMLARSRRRRSRSGALR